MPYNDLRRGRRSREGQIYLLTAATHGRRPIFASFVEATVVAREIARSERDGHWTLFAWVIMPDHLHLLVQLRNSSLGHAMRVLKGRSARALGRTLPAGAPVWQSGFHDRAIRRDESLKAIAWYVCSNPVRAGLVASMRAYSFWDVCWLSHESSIASG